MIGSERPLRTTLARVIVASFHMSVFSFKPASLRLEQGIRQQHGDRIQVGSLIKSNFFSEYKLA
jgi:hypothetical protein